MRKRQLWVCFVGPGPYAVFSVVLTLGIGFLAASYLGWVSLGPSEKITLFCGLLAGGVVFWQGDLLARQLAYGAVLELYKEWDSESMQERRKNAWKAEDEVPDPSTIEDVLEFLEKVSTLARNRYVSRKFIWDTFGWYVTRYFFYCKEEINRLRTKWTHKTDPTLYQDLEFLYPILMEREAKERAVSVKEIETEFQRTRKMFILSERNER